MPKDLLKLNKLIPNKDYDSLYRIFHVDYDYLELMRNYVTKKRYQKKLLKFTHSEYYDYKGYFDSIRHLGPGIPIQILNW